MKRFCFGFNRRNAEQELAELEKQIETHDLSFQAIASKHIEHREPHDRPIRELVELYLDWVAVNRAVKTHETATYLLRPFVKFCGDCMVSDLSTASLMKYYGWVKRTLGKGENGGNHHMRLIKTLLRWGDEMEVCLCPLRRFPMMREAPASTKKFTDEELVLLLHHAMPNFREMILFGLLTGLRPQELRELRQIHIRKDEHCWSVVLERHKTSRSVEIAQPRCVPLSDEAREIVQLQMLKHPESAFVFLNHHGKPYTASVFRNRLKRACKRAGIEAKPPYALRHYFGTKQAATGLNQTVLAQLMGHTKLHTTSRYIASVPEYHKKAVEAMASNLSGLMQSKKEEEKSTSEVSEKKQLLNNSCTGFAFS